MAVGTSPDTDNLYVGKGIVYFQKAGAGSYTDLGEVPEVELTLTTTILDYFSSRSGVRTKVKSVVLERGGTVRVRMDEWSVYNAQLYFLGTADMLAVGGPKITLLADDQIEGQLKFNGTNDVGPHWLMELYKVQIRPTRSISLIQERDWGGMEITGEVLNDATNGFGYLQQTNYGNVDS